MTIADEDLTSQFGEAVDRLSLQSDNINGLKLIAAMALLIWKAFGLGATRKQMEALIVRPTADSLFRKQFSKAFRLALHWRRRGVPDDIKAANSDEAARDAVITWLLIHCNVYNQDDLGHFLNGTPLSKPDNPRVEQLAEEIAGALRNTRHFFQHTAAEFAVAIVEKLPPDQAIEFADAATAAAAKR